MTGRGNFLLQKSTCNEGFVGWLAGRLTDWVSADCVRG